MLGKRSPQRGLYEAKRRADLDLSWKVALGIEIDQRPFAKSTLQMFRAQLILHDRVRAIFQRSLEYAQETGYLRGRKMKAVLDTSYILGRGAVQDTYTILAQGNLLAEGITKLIWALARYFGRTKTLFQALLAATVANLTLIAGKMGRMGRQRSQEDLLGFLLSRFKVAVKWLWAHSSSIIPSRSSSSLPWQPPRPCFRPRL